MRTDVTRVTDHCLPCSYLQPVARKTPPSNGQPPRNGNRAESFRESADSFQAHDRSAFTTVAYSKALIKECHKTLNRCRKTLERSSSLRKDSDILLAAGNGRGSRRKRSRELTPSD